MNRRRLIVSHPPGRPSRVGSGCRVEISGIAAVGAVAIVDAAVREGREAPVDLAGIRALAAETLDRGRADFFSIRIVRDF